MAWGAKAYEKWLATGFDRTRSLCCITIGVQPTKVAGTLRRAVRWSELTMIPVERHMECAYYFWYLGSKRAQGLTREWIVN